MKKASGKLWMIGMICVLFLGNSICVQAEEYRYDELNRVTEVIYDDGSRVKYVYDKNGNITEVIVDSDEESYEDVSKSGEEETDEEDTEDSSEPAESQNPNQTGSSGNEEERESITEIENEESPESASEIESEGVPEVESGPEKITESESTSESEEPDTSIEAVSDNTNDITEEKNIIEKIFTAIADFFRMIIEWIKSLF